MIVFKHLVTAYRMTYAWFWGIMALMLAGLCVSFEIFGHYVLDSQRASIWEVAGTQAPRWFLFVMALMFATVNLPVVVAHSVTRRSYFQGTVLFGLASSVFSATMLLLGFGVERWVYHLDGIWAELTKPYPVNTLGEAAGLWLELFVTLAASMVSGWLAGLVFYRLRLWVALVCMPLAAGPLVAVSSAPLGRVGEWELALTAAATLIAVAGGYLLVRGVAIRPRKA
jgi:hypothetical protein